MEFDVDQMSVLQVTQQFGCKGYATMSKE